MQNALTLALPGGLQVLSYGQAADSDCFVVTRATARKYGLTSLADLAKQNGELAIGAAPEVKKRRVGAVGLKDVYGVEFKEFKEFKSLDSDGPLVKGAVDYPALKRRACTTGITGGDAAFASSPAPRRRGRGRGR